MNRKLILKTMISTLVLYQVESVKASENLTFPYHEVFTNTEIYDQTGIKPGPKYKKKALKRLYDRKERQLTRALAIYLAPKLVYLKSALRIGIDQKYYIGIISGITRVATWPLQCIPDVGQYFAPLDQAVAEMAKLKYISNEHKDLTSIIPNLLTDIINKKAQIKGMYNGLRSEKIKEIEECYVQHKCDLNYALQQSIEEALIKARSPEHPFFRPDDFAKQALQLPTTQINLGQKFKWGEFDHKFKSEPYFNSLDSNTRNNVYLIIKKAFFYSMSNDVSSMMRDSLFLYGNPGNGKTKLARYIADFLGFPYYELSLISKKSIGTADLNGATWRIPGNPTGITADVFLKSQSKDGKKYKNTVLILNDVHEILKESSAESYFLELIDPEKKEFLNAYFEAPVDWSRVLVLLTSNAELRGIPAVQSPQHTTAANFPEPVNTTSPLADRMTVVHVPDLKAEQVKESLLTLCENYKTMFHTKSGIHTNQCLVDQVFEENAGASMRKWKMKLFEKVVAMDSNPEAQALREERIQTFIPKLKDELGFISVGNDVIAFKTESGKQKWRNNYSDYENVAQIYYGKDANLLFICKNGYAWGVNPENGQQKWFNPLTGFGKSAYSTMAATGEKLFLGFNKCIVVLNSKTGVISESLNIKGGPDVTLSLHNNKLYAGEDRGGYMFKDLNNLNDEKKRKNRVHRKAIEAGGDGIDDLSVNNKYACFIHNGKLQVNDAETSKGVRTLSLDDKKAIVVCDDDEQDNIYIATKTKIQLLNGKTRFSAVWTHLQGGVESLNITKDSQNNRILVCSQNKKVFALDPQGDGQGKGKVIWEHEIPDHFILNDSGKIAISPAKNGTTIVAFNGNYAGLSTSDGKVQWELIMLGNKDSLINGIATTHGKPGNSDDLFSSKN